MVVLPWLAQRKDSGLENATKTLSDLQAEESIPLEILRSRLDKSVELLISKLLQPRDPGWDLGIHSHFPWTLWISLGRCLILGNDHQHGIIALEQIMFIVEWKSRSSCCYCHAENSHKFHLCEDCCDGVFCKNCIERHQLLFRNSTYGHSVTKFPRQLFCDVPEGQVALDKNKYLPVQVWLEGLWGWTAKL